MNPFPPTTHKLTLLSISDDDIDIKPPAKKATTSKAKPKQKVDTKMDLDDSDDDCEYCNHDPGRTVTDPQRI